MKAVLVSPFLTSSVVDLSAFVVGDPHEARQRLSARPFPGWDVLVESVPEAMALIQDHEPIGATLVPRRLLSARQLPGSNDLWQPGVTTVELSVGVHGVGAVLLWADVADHAALQAIEEAACSGIAPVAAATAEFLRDGLPGRQHRPVSGRYPVDEFLWWHRVFAVEEGDLHELEPHLVGAVRRLVKPRQTLVVADGYTAVTGASEEDLAAVVRGVVDGQEVWVAGETASREVITQIAALQAAKDLSPRELAAAAQTATTVAERQDLRAAILQDQVRYTTGTRRVALDVSAQAWGMSLDHTPVSLHLDRLRAMLQRRVDERRLGLEKRLSLGVFALTVLSSFGLILAFFETAFGLPLEHNAARLLFAAGTFLLAVAAVAGAIRWFERNHL